MNFKDDNRERPEQFCNNHEVWEALSNAIVKSACDDYKLYTGRGRQDIEKFFRSEYFQRISNIDPEWLIKKLRESFPPRIR